MEKLLNQYGAELLSCKVQSGGISIATFCCIILLMLILGLVGRRAAILASVCRKNKPFIVITAIVIICAIALGVSSPLWVSNLETVKDAVVYEVKVDSGSDLRGLAEMFEDINWNNYPIITITVENDR